MSLREHANQIIQAALTAAQPDEAVKAALDKTSFSKGNIILVAVGKAAWQMAHAALQQLTIPVKRGIVITKYGHSSGSLPGLDIYEAGHPIPDENSFLATESAMNMVTNLSEQDTVLFLLSGGGSALFEKPLIPENDLNRLTRELLACGADIVEINTLRKRFSAVKGGRFAQLCAPAKVFTIVLSDVLGDRLDMIASGPACADSSTCAEAQHIAEKYRISLTEQMRQLLTVETPKELTNVETHITGSVRQLCLAAERSCRELGYEPLILTDQLSCTARDAGKFLGSIARFHQNSGRKLAFLAGGETVVHLTGSGLGGRNQELALSAAETIAGMNACVFSIGSDGTDGPTDAAGGYVDGDSCSILKEQGISIDAVLQNNDSYHALQRCGGLLITGPTGTNVNDLSVLLIGD